MNEALYMKGSDFFEGSFEIGVDKSVSGPSAQGLDEGAIAEMSTLFEIGYWRVS